MVRHLFSHTARTVFFQFTLCVMRDSLLSFTSRSLLMQLLFCKANSLLNGILKNIPQCLCFHVKIVLTWKPCKSFQAMCMFEVKRERSIESRIYLTVQPRIQGGGPGGPGPPPDPRFWGPKIEHFAALFNFSIIFFASLCSAYYFFNMLLFHSSNWKIFQPRFARHCDFSPTSLSFTHFRLLGIHLSLSCF